MTSLFDSADQTTAMTTPQLDSAPPSRPSVAVVPGSFDPITMGHCDVIARAATLFDQVIVAVGANLAKTTLFSLGQRLELIQHSLPEDPNIDVAVAPGLLTDFCQEVGAHVIVKGLRGEGDLSHEEPMALINRDLTGIETIFLPASPTCGYVSSSLVREVASHGGNVSRYVSPAVEAALRRVFS